MTVASVHGRPPAAIRRRATKACPARGGFAASRVPERMRALYSTDEHTPWSCTARRGYGNRADVALLDRARAAVVMDREPRVALYPACRKLGGRRTRPAPHRRVRRDGISRRA